jgi:hypothetical protein
MRVLEVIKSPDFVAYASRGRVHGRTPGVIPLVHAIERDALAEITAGAEVVTSEGAHASPLMVSQSEKPRSWREKPRSWPSSWAGRALSLGQAQRR